MGHIFLAVFLLLFGLNLMFGLGVPPFVTGLLALLAGVFLLIERFGLHIERRR